MRRRPRRRAARPHQDGPTGLSRPEADLAALALRLGIGPMLVAHGSNKVWGAGGLEGTTKWFDHLGLRPAHLHARLAAATEITAGAAVTLGVGAPLPEAAVIGLMATAARTDHRGKGLFVFKGGWEYVGVVGLVAAVLARLGHGRWSLDRLVGRPTSGSIGAMAAAAALGVGAAAALLATSYHPSPPVEGPTAEPVSASDEEPAGTDGDPAPEVS
ncbi:MAG TPA: DoxX family protein [Acidimicrobiales bacterium]|nr:DoxX family protein [Acidimicrobiales bacterium]